MKIEYASLARVEGYNKAVTAVSEERRFLATVHGFPMDGSRWYLNRQIGNGWPMYFAVEGDEVVGWCDIAAKEIPEFAHVGVMGMGVLRDYRGQGLGKALLEAALGHAQRRGFEKVELRVFASNAPALSLYRSLGFEIEGRRPNSRKLDGRYEDEIEMGLFLGASSARPRPQLTYGNVQDYLTGLVPERPPILKAMEKQAQVTDFPIIGPAAGYQCYQLARLIGARRVFEMGSGFGYSTAWFARAVAENGGGEVHHVVWDQGLSDQAQAALSELGYGSIVTYHVAEAVETLRKVPGPFDLIFNDIEKEDYPGCLPLIGEKLRQGGLLLVDNLLWDGRIFDPGDESPATQGVRELARRISADPAWIATILPVRDGLLAAMKR